LKALPALLVQMVLPVLLELLLPALTVLTILRHLVPPPLGQLAPLGR